MGRRRKHRVRPLQPVQPDLLRDAGLDSPRDPESEVEREAEDGPGVGETSVSLTAPASEAAPEALEEEQPELGPEQEGGRGPEPEARSEPAPAPVPEPFRLEPQPEPPPRPAPAPGPMPVPRWMRRVAELEELGNLEKALEVAREALEASPGDPRVLLREIHLLGTLGRFDEGEEPLRLLRLAEGNTVEVRRAAGIFLFRRGMYPEAEAELLAAVRSGDPSGQSHYYLGEALNRLGRVDEALEILGQAVDLNPRESRAYSTMGRLLDRKGLPEAAAVMYRKAREASR